MSENIKVRWLVDNEQTKIAPKTFSTQILNEDGTHFKDTVETSISEIDEKIIAHSDNSEIHVTAEEKEGYATKEYVENLYMKLNSNTVLGFYCIEDVTIVINGISKIYPANSNVEITFIEGDTFEIVPTSDNSILTLNAFPSALGTFYPWLEGVAQFSNILFDMNDEAMYSKWSQGNQGSYHVQAAQYTNCIFWSDNPYISDVAKRTNYTLTHTSQLPLCYSTIPDNTFKSFYLAFGVNNDPNWGNPVYRDSFSKATWATQAFSYYGARTIGIVGHDDPDFNIVLPKDCRGLMFDARDIENAGTFDAISTTNFGAKAGSWREAFGFCSSLRRLYIKNLKVSLNISWSPIDYDSIYFIISAATNTNNITISVSPYTYNLLKDSDFELAASKNITIELLTANYVEDRRLSAIDNKADKEHTHDDVYYTEIEIDTKISEIENSINNSIGDIAIVYETKADAQVKFDEAKGYTDAVASGKADSVHNHDDIYYTEAEINSMLDGKANISDIPTKTSDLTNDSGFITSADVPVTKVNGKIGDVILTASDVGADASGSASAVQSNLDVLNDEFDDHINNTDIHFTSSERTKLSGLENYIHPVSGVSEGTYKSVTVDANGHVTSGSNPTTLAGYGITDAEAKGTVNTHNVATDAHNDIRLLISDVSTKLNNFLNVNDTTKDQLSEIIALIEANADDIESITSGKVNVSDIINNLTTNVDNKPLSAAQGVAIKVLIDALQEELNTDIANLSTHTGNSTIHITANERTNWNDAYAKRHEHDNKSVLDNTTASYTITEQAKLSGIQEGAEVNQNAFSSVKVGTTTIEADNKTDSIEFVGDNVSIIPDATNDKITFKIEKGTTDTFGIVKLTDSTSSTSTTTAATPNSVKSAYDLANSANTKATNAQTTADGKSDKGHKHIVSEITDLTATATELNYMDGVTSNVQTQLDGKSNSDHTHTAEDVGARPDTWMPSAEDVGASPSGHSHTAKDVGARPNTWMPTASDVGAIPRGGTRIGEIGFDANNDLYILIDGTLYKLPFGYGRGDAPFLPLTGGTLTGSLTMPNAVNITRIMNDILYKTVVAPSGYAIDSEVTSALAHYIDGVQSALLLLNENGVAFRDLVNNKQYNIFGQHNTVPVKNGGTGATTAEKALQNIVGFKPVQQGGGTSQGTNKIYIGWSTSSDGIRCTVDSTDIGYMLTGPAMASGAVLIGNGGGKVTSRPITNNTTVANASGTNIPTCNTLNYHVREWVNRDVPVDAADTGYNAYRARGIALVTSVPSSITNGCAAFVYQ